MITIDIDTLSVVWFTKFWNGVQEIFPTAQFKETNDGERITIEFEGIPSDKIDKVVTAAKDYLSPHIAIS